ncbi:MAG: PAS domain-containing protein [Deltaproteobacteria bacterium]|nr:PAS domain-containing protein [Deltaproteobacteria bacterium]
MNSRLLFRIFRSYLIIGGLSILVLSLFIHGQVKKQTIEHIEDQLTTYGRIIAQSPQQDIERNLHLLAGSANARLTLIDGGGKVLADSEHDVAQLDNHLNRTEIQEARLKGKGKAIRYSQTLHVDMLYTAIPIYSRDFISGYIRLARPLYAITASLQNLYESLLTAVLIVIPAALIIALIFSYRLTAPIKAMEEYTEHIRKGDGSGILLINTSDELKTLAGNINYLVDELKSKIQAADEEKGKLLAAFASMNEGVLILNRQQRIEFCNQAMENILDARYGQIGGKTLMEALRNVELENAFQRHRESRLPVTQEIVLGDAKKVILDCAISPVEGLPGDEKTMIVFHDVTRLKALENIRADFVANVTHEIKTPLTAILGYVETLQAGTIKDRAEAVKFLDIISRQAMRLNRLVEDLLVISKIELGEMRFRFETVSVRDIIRYAIPIIEPKAVEKQIAVWDRIPEALPAIKGDRDRLTQIFLNVLDNAVKFTPENGEVVLSAEEMNGDLVVRISDTGIGVPKEDLARMGERFYRVDKTRSRELGGTGLGLSIVKHLMQAHGGAMKIDSQLGKGTIVSLHFPKIEDDASV